MPSAGQRRRLERRYCGEGRSSPHCGAEGDIRRIPSSQRLTAAARRLSKTSPKTNSKFDKKACWREVLPLKKSCSKWPRPTTKSSHPGATRLAPCARGASWCRCADGCSRDPTALVLSCQPSGCRPKACMTKRRAIAFPTILGRQRVSADDARQLGFVRVYRACVRSAPRCEDRVR